MDLYIYSDESGVFDKTHNDFFVFGGIICFGNEQKEIASRKYSSIEKSLKEMGLYKQNEEIKACKVSPKTKYKLYKSLNKSYKFCVLINQKQIMNSIFENKKHKQRYLDYVYKMCLKKSLKYLISKKYINPYIIKNIYVYADEHHTATDGLYELRENLLSEFKYGTFNENWNICYEPLFPSINNIDVHFCDSSKTLLVRAADIVVNHFYHIARENNGEFFKTKNCFILLMPTLKICSTGEEFFTLNRT